MFGRLSLPFHRTTVASLAASVTLAFLTLFPVRAQNWVQKSPLNNPPAGSGYAMAYGGQIVLFANSTTWVWDGVNWTQKTPQNSPPPRAFASMAYDEGLGQFVLFGGHNLQQPFNAFSDTWVWDGTNWIQKTPSNMPPGLYGAAMAYDAARRRVVLFGGCGSAACPASDTWLWDGVNWTQAQPQTHPPGTWESAMAYDSALRQIVLFGGCSATCPDSDTWVWDGSTWAQKSPQSSPPARILHALAYDGARTEIILFGGLNGQPFSDTWAWDGGNWIQQSPPASPPARSQHAMAYDAATGQTVLFGGTGNNGALSDTWVLPGNILFASAGNPQSTPINTPFPFPLEVTVTDPEGNYLSGQIVTFSVDPSLAILSSTTAMTGADGRAHVTATATGVAASYAIAATLPDGGRATFVMSNVNTANASGPCLVTSAADDNGAGTLRYQVAHCGTGGTITFAPTLGTVQLTQGQDIQLRQDLTIDGGGVSIDAGYRSRIFFIFGGNIVLKNLTLRNGMAKGGNGGSANARNLISSGFLFPGGGAAGMGGAIFVNAGTLTASGVTFASNQAQGGTAGSLVDGPATTSGLGGGGGVGGDGGNGALTSGHGGGGGDFGSSGGSGQDGSGGDADSTKNAGFGGGSGGNANAGFGGGGGPVFGLSGADPGTFGGAGGSDIGGGGAGLGGAIFVRTGQLILNNSSFLANFATKGIGDRDYSHGQGKGGALFVMPAATAVYTGPAPVFSGNSATDSGVRTLCSSVFGPSALDTTDICGVLTEAGLGKGLSISVSHAGAFIQSRTGEWDIAVTNGGPNITLGMTTVSAALPPGYLVHDFSVTPGSWSCSGIGSATAMCTSTLPVLSGQRFPAIQLIVTVPPNAPAVAVLTAKTFGGGDLDHANLNTAASGSDVQNILPLVTPRRLGTTTASGPGPQLFEVSYVDLNGASDLQQVYLAFGGMLGSPNGCIALYQPANNVFLLVDDSGTGLVPGAIAPGESKTLSNSQCILSGASTGAFLNGTELNITFNLTDKSGFNGAKTIYGLAQSVNGSLGPGWVNLGDWTPNVGPIKVTPSGGAGLTQTFQVAYTVLNGVRDLQAAYFEIGDGLGAQHGCFAVYVPASNSLYLFDDTNSAALGPITPGSLESVSNSQCTLSGAGGPANNVTVPFHITFQPGFSGTKNMFAAAQTYSGMLGGSQSLGTWTPEPPQPLGAVSVNPNTGNGAVQMFHATYADPSGASDVQVVYLDVGNSIFAPGSCIVAYVPVQNALYLFNDQNTGVSGAITLGSSNAASNGQCTISGSGAVATLAGNNLSITVPLTFSAAFSGTHDIWGLAQNYAGAQSQWMLLGTWTR